MGTTLTGTTPANTYDSLIKVTDNGPLSGTAKYLSDGLGNDSKLSLSTSAIGINTTNPSGILQINGETGVLIGYFTEQGAGDPTFRMFYGKSTRPSYSFTSDNTSGMFSTAVGGVVAFSTNASERMRITSSGNVGIGTTTFDYWGYGYVAGGSINQLQSIGNSTDNVGIHIGSSTSSVNFATRNSLSSLTNINRIVSVTTSTSNNSESGYLAFYTKSGATSTLSEERLRIAANGNVGIGTSPLLRLDVKGAAADTTTFGGVTVEQTTLFRPSNDLGGMRFGFDASSNAYLWSATSGASLRLGTRLAPDNNVNMTLLANGNVGIGTDSPSRNLEVSASSASVAVVGTSSSVAKLELISGGVVNWSLRANQNAASDFTLYQDSTERLLFSSSGYLRLASGTNGILFNGDNAAANALDDYEEGTWTPVLRQGGVANTASYSFQGGSYTKVGNLVTVFFDVDTTSITAGSGVCEISGLPYSSGSSMAGYSYVSLRDPSALAGTVANSIFTGFVQRPAAYLVMRTLSATTGAEGSASSWNALGRVTGVAQYTV